MKVNPTIYYLCALYFLLQSSNFSQNTNYLLDFGAILTDVKWTNNAFSNRNRDIKPNFSFSIGGRISHIVDEMISLSLGLSYKNISFVEEFSPNVRTQINANSIDITRGENRYSLHSLSLPITIGYSPFSTYLPKLFTGIEFGFFVNGFEKQDYTSNVCTSCGVDAIPKPLDQRYFDNETELFQTKEGFLNFIVGISQSFKFYNRGIELRLIYFIPTDDVSFDYEFSYSRTISLKNIEFTLGLEL